MSGRSAGSGGYVEQEPLLPGETISLPGWYPGRGGGDGSGAEWLLDCTYTSPSFVPRSNDGAVLPRLCKLAHEQELSYNRKQKNSEP